jgi:hypothetical protein
MPKPNEKFTVAQMKSFIRSHKNIKIKLTQTRPNLIADLKKHGQWEGSAKQAKPKFKIDTSKQPSQKPSQIKMKYKPSLNIKEIKKATPKKQGSKAPQGASGDTVAGQLLDMPMDISDKIGKAVKEHKIKLKKAYKNGIDEGIDQAKEDLENEEEYNDIAEGDFGYKNPELIKSAQQGFINGYKKYWKKYKPPKISTIKSRWKKVFKLELDGAIMNNYPWSNMTDKYAKVIIQKIIKGETLTQVLNNVASMIRHGEIHNTEWL